jgi:hypothetical protein
MLGKGRPFFVVTLLAALAATPAVPAGVRHVSEYDISLGLLPIARASFASEFNEGDYTIKGNFRSAGLVSLISHISADTNVTGVMRGKRLQANNYSLVYTEGKKTRTYNVAYRNGDVVSTTITPEPKARPDTWVPIADGDLHSVLDPLSGLIFPDGAQICPSRLPIYDGESRLDLVLSNKRTKPFSTEGFKGDVTV